jgi:hypothetical protein
MKVFEITQDTRRLVDACDGWTTVDRLVTHYNQGSGEELGGSILSTLERLIALEVIEV